ncbi:MAG: lycopene beta-cyclase CrtY [Elusimicrobia bacterium]|nr:lycopene beta-cyclase CrtY [Elusimicrobiota bacterium]
MSAPDLAIVGGGLSGSLIGFRLKQVQPDVRVHLIERGAALGGNHTWSFHESDMTPAQISWMTPLISRRWDRNEVRFPSFARTFKNAYFSILSETLDRAVRAALPHAVTTRANVRSLEPTAVTLESGERVSAGCVIDARGIIDARPGLTGGLTFLGQDVELEEPHGIEHPVIMDTLCDQSDGFRFFYLLPWSERSLLIEDNIFSPSMELDADRFRRAIRAYAGDRGWRIASVAREEMGVLPIPLTSDFAAPAHSPVPRVGAGGGFFHYGTTYSIRHAVNFADEFAQLDDFAPAAVSAFVDRKRREHRRRNRFYPMLNRMLLMTAQPANAYRILERFYAMPERVIENFYADRLTLRDRLTVMFSGKPPLSLAEAVRLIFSSAPSIRRLTT